MYVIERLSESGQGSEKRTRRAKKNMMMMVLLVMVFIYKIYHKNAIEFDGHHMYQVRIILWMNERAIGRVFF